MDTIVPGALAAFVVDCSIFPLDTIKSRVQSADYVTRYPNGRGLYTGLWQGFGPVVLATLPSAAVFFTTYEHAKATFAAHPWAQNDKRVAAAAHTLSSALAELAACAILTPAETIKQQRQVARASSTTSTAALFSQLTGRSLLRGYWALAGRNLPFTAMQFPLYEHFRGHLSAAFGLRKRKGVQRAAHQGTPRDRKDVDATTRARQKAWQVQQKAQSHATTPPAGDGGAAHYTKAGLVSGASAAGAGAIAALITTPLDLIKTRIMLSSSSASGATTTLRALTLDIWRREGVRGFMRGGLLRSGWTALGAGIYLGSYEAGREWWSDAGEARVHEVAERAHDLVDGVQTQS